MRLMAKLLPKIVRHKLAKSLNIDDWNVAIGCSVCATDFVFFLLVAKHRQGEKEIFIN